MQPSPVDPLKHTLFYLKNNNAVYDLTPEELVNEYYGSRDPIHNVAVGKGVGEEPLGRRSIQVAGEKE